MENKIFSWKGLKLNVLNPNIYQPKPASILLAETSLKIVKSNDKVLDVCTGSGIVAIAIAKFVPIISDANN